MTLSKALVSVVVPTYNRKWLLPRTLQSLAEQSHTNLDIVLVNDGGEDVSDVIRDVRIQYIQNEKNVGLAASRNVALRHCKGDYICLLDDDDIYLPYTIEFRLQMMERLGAEIVYSRALRDHWERRDNGYASIGKSLYWDSPFDSDLILIQNIAPCCCPLFSRKSWEGSEYWFDETMTSTEDHDFWTALSRKNTFYELKLVDCECSYRTDNSQMTGSRNFVPNWIKTFQRWRHTASDLAYVTNAQNEILRRVGINPEDYGL